MHCSCVGTDSISPSPPSYLIYLSKCSCKKLDIMRFTYRFFWCFVSLWLPQRPGRLNDMLLPFSSSSLTSKSVWWAWNLAGALITGSCVRWNFRLIPLIFKKKKKRKTRGLSKSFILLPWAQCWSRRGTLQKTDKVSFEPQCEVSYAGYFFCSLKSACAFSSGKQNNCQSQLWLLLWST